MPNSESEDFESADEEIADRLTEKKQVKKPENEAIKYDKDPAPIDEKKAPSNKDNDGWDDFDIDDGDECKTKPVSEGNDSKLKQIEDYKTKPTSAKREGAKTKDGDGWAEFDDWEDSGQQCDSSNEVSTEKNEKLRSVADRLSTASSQQSSWGWGWGVDSIISSATAGISTITSHVSQGLSTVLESGIGAPDPEELARMSLENKKTSKKDDADLDKKDTKEKSDMEELPIKELPLNEDTDCQNEEFFPFGNILSGVTKFVENTGTKVISGGLETLETIGKKTMEVLQDGDPGLAKKRAMLGLDAGDKPVLSQVLREAKDKAEEQDRMKEEKREAKEVHYETLFDDFEGLVHLEALEMLSKQVSMRIEEKLRNSAPEKRLEIKETLQQVAELCEMPDSDDEDEPSAEDSPSKPDGLLSRLTAATEDLGVKLTFQPLIQQYTEVLEWLAGAQAERAVYKRAVSALAQGTALAVELYHRGAELLLVKGRRSTADEADALAQMTAVLSRHVTELATLFTEKLNSLPPEERSDQLDTYITNIFLEAGNSSTYIQNAFQLTLPILQIGAA